MRPHAATASGTVDAGVQIRARSGVSGIASTEVCTGKPWISPPFGFTGYTAPAKPESLRARRTWKPRFFGSAFGARLTRICKMRSQAARSFSGRRYMSSMAPVMPRR